MARRRVAVFGLGCGYEGTGVREWIKLGFWTALMVQRSIG